MPKEKGRSSSANVDVNMSEATTSSRAVGPQLTKQVALNLYRDLQSDSDPSDYDDLLMTMISGKIFQTTTPTCNQLMRRSKKK